MAPGDAARAAVVADHVDLLGALLHHHHRAGEEEHVLPLAATHMTPVEWQRLGEEGMAGLPRKQLPLVFGMVMYNADPEIIRGMLSPAPLLPRLLMPRLAPRVYARYARRIHGTATP